MDKRNVDDSELFFWVKSGKEFKSKRIHSIQQTKPKDPPSKVTLKKPKIDIDSPRAGLKTGWIRATFIVKEDKLKKIKALAYWDRKDIKQTLDEALETYLADKTIKPLPDGK